MSTVKGSTLNRGINAADKPYFIQDLTGTDQTAALQNAINDAQTRGRDLRIPTGRIEHTGLTLPSGFSIKIDAEPDTLSITELVNTSGTANTFTALGIINGGVLENLNIAQIDGVPSTVPTGSTGAAILADTVNAVTNFKLNTVSISGHADGVHLSNARNCYIDILSVGTSVTDGTGSIGTGIKLTQNGGGLLSNNKISDKVIIQNYDVGVDNFSDQLVIGNCRIINYAAAGYKSNNAITTYLQNTTFESIALFSPVSSIIDVTKNGYIHHYRGTVGLNDTLPIDVAGIGTAGMGRYATTLNKNSKAYMFPTSDRTLTRAVSGMDVASNWNTIVMDVSSAATTAQDFGRDTESVTDLPNNTIIIPEDGHYQFNGQVMVKISAALITAPANLNLTLVATLIVDGAPTTFRLIDNENDELFGIAVDTIVLLDKSLPVNITAFLEKGQTVELGFFWREAGTVFTVTALAPSGPAFDRNVLTGTRTNNPPMATYLEIVGPLD